MRSFDKTFLKKQQFPFSLLQDLKAIHLHKERFEGERRRSPMVYEQLRRDAKKKSRIRSHHSTLENEDLERVGAFVQKNHQKLDLNFQTLQTLHRLLFASSDKPKGVFKSKNNRVYHRSKKLNGYVRCVPKRLSEKYLKALNRRCKHALTSKKYDPLIAIAAWVLDYLKIHPFIDGNGRTARLMLMLMLYQAGHEVCSYINLERLVIKTRGQYYRPLIFSLDDWNRGKYELAPMCEYVAKLILSAYREIERKAAAL